MSPFVITINQALAVLTVIGQIIAIVLLASLIVFRKKQSPFFAFISNNAFLFSFIVALVAMSGSLFYSEVAGFTPCVLCWYQRILMYPQVIFFGVALWKGEKRTADYHIALSALGAFISVYHYLLQIGVLSELPCSAVGFSVSCAQKFVMNFGYITIPLMAFTAFVSIILFMLVTKTNERIDSKN